MYWSLYVKSEIYLNVATMYKIFLIAPVIVASTERSFLKFLKNYQKIFVILH